MQLGVYHLIYLKLIFGFSISFLLTFYLVPFFSLVAKRFCILDIPDGILKVHEKPVPYLGGLAIYVGFIATLAIIFPFDNKFVLLLLGSTLLLFVGLMDDLLRLKPYQKFFWQMIACFCFLKSGLYLKEKFFVNNLANIPLSFLWILAVINAFNLVDVMDGLATLLAASVAISLLALALMLQKFTLALLLSTFLGALFAFFYYNKPPAQIYLGDAGSLFIGGLLATTPFIIEWSTFNTYGFLALPIIMAIPLFEITSLVLIRSYKGIPFYAGSPHHFALLLQQMGWSKNQILWFMVFLSVILSIQSFLFFLNRIAEFTILLSTSMVFLTVSFLGYRKRAIVK